MELSLNDNGFFTIYRKSYRDSILIFPKNKKSKVFPGILGYWKGGKNNGDTITLIIASKNKPKYIISQDCLIKLSDSTQL